MGSLPCAVLSPNVEMSSQRVLRDRQNERGNRQTRQSCVAFSRQRQSQSARFEAGAIDSPNEVWSGSGRSIAEVNFGKYDLAHILILHPFTKVLWHPGGPSTERGRCTPESLLSKGESPRCPKGGRLTVCLQRHQERTPGRCQY